MVGNSANLADTGHCPLKSLGEELLLCSSCLFFCFVYFSHGQEHGPGPKPCRGGPRCSGCRGEEKERCDPGRPVAVLGHLSANSGSWALLQPHGFQGQKGAQVQDLLVMHLSWGGRRGEQHLPGAAACLGTAAFVDTFLGTRRTGGKEGTHTSPEAPWLAPANRMRTQKDSHLLRAEGCI